MLTCHVGYWEDRLSFSPCSEDETVVRNMGPLGMIVLDRAIVVAPDRKGLGGYDISRERNAGLGLCYEWRGISPNFVRFRRHEMEVTVDDDDGTMTVDVPADHALLWPVMKRGKNLDMHAVAYREFEARCRSAFREGGSELVEQVVHSVPQNFRDYLPAATWKQALDVAMAT